MHPTFDVRKTSPKVCKQKGPNNYFVVGCWLFVVGCLLLVVWCFVFVVGCWLLVAGCWLFVVCCLLRPLGAKGGSNALSRGTFWETFSSTMHPNIYARINVEKYWIIYEIAQFRKIEMPGYCKIEKIECQGEQQVSQRAPKLS